MKTTPSSITQREEIKNQAIEWLIRLDSAHCTAKDRHAFEQWQAQHALHGVIFNQVASRLSQLEHLAQKDTQIRQQALRYRSPKLKRFSRYTKRFASAVTVILILGFATFSSDGWLGFPQYHQVLVGKQQTIYLADGTQLDLNTNTQVRIRISYWQREIKILQGEVFLKWRMMKKNHLSLLPALDVALILAQRLMFTKKQIRLLLPCRKDKSVLKPSNPKMCLRSKPLCITTVANS
jgi:ferric-dicitrate binding protein FerR (iron transport regulator)